jgi:hypothetical protein
MQMHLEVRGGRHRLGPMKGRRGRPRIERPFHRGLGALALLLLVAGLFFDARPCCARTDLQRRPELLASDCCLETGAGSCPAILRISPITDRAFVPTGPAAMAEASLAATLSPPGRPPVFLSEGFRLAPPAPPPRALHAELLI